MRTRRLREAVWAAPLVALALRLLLFAAAAPHPDRFTIDADSHEYLRLARNLALGHGFSQAERAPYDPDVRRTPLYPSTLAALFTIGGTGVRLAAAISIAASVATVLALVQLTTRLFGAAAGRVAGVLLALDVTSASYATQALTEPLFTLLLVLALLAASDPGAGEALRGISSGTLTGMASLCRPIGVLLAAALLPACRWRARADGGRTAVAFAIAAAVSAVPIGAWTLRNARVSGVTTFTSQAATNVYFHRAAYVAARLEGRRVEAVRDDWTREFEAASASWTGTQRIEWMNEHGRSLILSHPFTYAIVFVKGMVRMLGPDTAVLPPLLGLGRGGPGWTAVVTIGWMQLALVYALAVYGAWIGAIRAPAAVLVPLGVLAYFLILGGPEMYPRFRVPLMPALCMLAATGAAGATGARIEMSPPPTIADAARH